MLYQHKLYHGDWNSDNVKLNITINISLTSPVLESSITGNGSKNFLESRSILGNLSFIQ